MRVYEDFSFNLNEILFIDNLDFIDNVLHKHGMKYEAISFDFTSDWESKNCNKTAKLFPSMTKYIRFKEPHETIDPHEPVNPIFTSLRTDENGNGPYHADSEDIETLKLLLKKVPTSINFGFSNVMADFVNWYGDESENVSFGNPQTGVFCFTNYYSNHIRFTKHFDSGKKYNIFTLRIDRTGTDTELRPYPENFLKLAEEFGKPVQKELCLYFGETEKALLEKSKTEISNKIKAYKPLKKIPYSLDMFSSTLPVKSPKSVFGKEAKKYGFNSFKYEDCLYYYKKITENNHTVEVQIQKVRSTGAFRSHVSFYGFNFNHSIAITEKPLFSEADFKAFAQLTFEAALSFEDEFKDIILSVYGKSPQWYIKEK